MFSRRSFLLGGVATSSLLLASPVSARFPRGSSSSSGFNGKLLQTNPNFLQGGGDYPWLNALLGAQAWSFSNNADAPVTPDMLDANGYLISSAGNAAGGISTVFNAPSQAERPGAWIYDWQGDGTVDSHVTSGSAVAYNISSVTQSGGIQTVNLSSAPNEMVAGQPINMSPTGASGTWASGFTGSYSVLDVNISGHSFRINTGTTFTGTAPTGGSATFQTSTSVQNGSGGLNGSGRYAFQPTATAGGGNGITMSCGITAINSSVNYPKNIRVYHINDQTLINTPGNRFTTQFLNVMKNFGVIRFLNWSVSNVSNMTTWATRKPDTYAFYAGDQRRSDLYSGGTSLTGTKFSASAPSTWPGLVDKATVHVVFNQSYSPIATTFTNGSSSIGVPSHGLAVNAKLTFDTDFGGGTLPTNFTFGTTYFVVSVIDANTITVSATQGGTAIVAGSAATGNIKTCPFLTLNIGGTGDTNILSQFSSNLSFTGNSYPVANKSNSFATLVYDSTLNSWIKQGGDIGIGQLGLDNGASYEAMLALCVAVGAHPHWPMPVLAIDPATDFLPSLLAYCVANAPSWLIPRVEGPNELWNTTGQFSTVYAKAKSKVYWGAADYHNWYGKALSTIGQIGAAVYGIGNLGTKYQILGGVQTTTGESTGDIANSLPRFAANSYVSLGPVQSSLTGNWAAGGGSLTINFSAIPASPNSVTGPSATQLVSHLCCAQYVNTNSYSTAASGGLQGGATLAATFNGSQFTGSAIVSGAFSITNVSGATPAVGDTIFGPGIPISSGVTIATNPSAGNYTLSDNTINITSTQSYMTATTPSAAHSYIQSLTDTVFNGTIVGNQLTVNSLTSGGTIGQGYYSGATEIYGGTIAYGSFVVIVSGTYPTFTLNTSPGNQTANFSYGAIPSMDGLAKLYLNWATWVKNNFGVLKMCGYEGGYSDDYGSHGTAVDLLTAWAKQDTTLGTYMTQNWNNFRGVGAVSYPSGFTAEFPSVFNTTGQWPSNNAWSVLEDIYQSPTPSQWSAITSYH